MREHIRRNRKKHNLHNRKKQSRNERVVMVNEEHEGGRREGRGGIRKINGDGNVEEEDYQ
jgi:hypothetical protein